MGRQRSRTQPRRNHAANRRRTSPYHLFGGSAIVAIGALLIWGATALDWPLYLIWLVAINVVALAFYWFDKQQARGNRLRVPERVLLLLALAGGFVGGFVGMKWVRHKTDHLSFWVAQVLGLLLWSGAIWWLEGNR